MNSNVDRIILFGSRSRDDYEKYSDLDLAVDCPNMSRLEWLKLKEFVTYDLKIFIRMSLVSYHSNPSEIKERILNSGIVLYEKGKTKRQFTKF
jgi:predicted nucleotidyltransferase